MKKVKQQPKARPPSKLDEITATTERQSTHLHSAELNGKLIVLSCERGELERREAALQGALTAARSRHAEVTATMRGLNAVLDARRNYDLRKL